MEILQLHLRKLSLAPDAKPDPIAALTPGFTGADLANRVNEAAIFATRRDAAEVNLEDFVAAMERRTPAGRWGEPNELIGALAPRHMLIVAPLHDGNFRADSVDRVAKAASSAAAPAGRGPGACGERHPPWYPWGETPSPELVAEAGNREGMKPGRAILLGLCALLVALGAARWGGQMTITGYLPLEKRPEVLADRARTILADLGYVVDVNRSDPFVVPFPNFPTPAPLPPRRPTRFQ
mgnify:CR=1 FL=1